MADFHDFSFARLSPGMTTDEPSEKQHGSNQKPPITDHPFPIFTAGRVMSAEAVRVQVSERSVIRRKRGLVELDQPDRRAAGEKLEMYDEIAHIQGCRYARRQHTMQDIVTSADILDYLQITVAVLLVVVLYHCLFIVVDLRKVLRRIEVITKEVESLIMKPINVADHILEGIVKYLESQEFLEKKGKKKSHKS